MMVRVFPGDHRLKKMVLDASLLNNQQYKVRIKGSGAIQVKKSRPPLHLGALAVANFTYNPAKSVDRNEFFITDISLMYY